MIENTTINEFRENEYEKAAREFRDRTVQAAAAEIDNISEQVRITFAGLFQKLGELQESGMQKAGEITISLLHVSVWEGPARARIDVYDKDQTLGILLYTEDLDVSWLFAEWEAFRERLVRLAEKKGVRRYVKDPVIRWMMGGEVTRMAEYLYGMLKYLFLEADRFPHFEEMKRRPEFFISVGEYQDWQRVLFVRLPETDILEPPEDYPLMWQNVHDRGFKGQRFTDLDLSKARFTNCRFIQCSFEHVSLNDVCFAQCTFRDVELKSGTMYGAAFLDCELTNVDFSDMKQRWIPFDGTGTENDIYRDIQVEHCRMTNVREDVQP